MCCSAQLTLSVWQKLLFHTNTVDKWKYCLMVRKRKCVRRDLLAQELVLSRLYSSQELGTWAQLLHIKYPLFLIGKCELHKLPKHLLNQEIIKNIWNYGVFHKGLQWEGRRKCAHNCVFLISWVNWVIQNILFLYMFFCLFLLSFLMPLV